MPARRPLVLIGLAVLAAGVISPASSPAGHNGPLAGQWHLETADPTTPDSSGHGLTGTAGGGLEGTDGRFGSALLFDPTSFVNVPTSPLLEPDRVTLVAWVRSDGSPGVARSIVTKGGDPGCTASSYALDTGSGGIEFYVRGPGSSARFSSPAASVGTVWDAEWHGVAGVYDGATVRLYVDGQQVGAGAPGPASIDYNRSERRLTMGQYAGCTGYDYGERLDEVQVYDRALSGSEIAALHNPSATSPPVIAPSGGGGGGGAGGSLSPLSPSFTTDRS